LGLIYGYMRHLRVLLTCLKIVGMHCIIEQRESKINLTKNKVGAFSVEI
jgi:hypothetical protein